MNEPRSSEDSQSVEFSNHRRIHYRIAERVNHGSHRTPAGAVAGGYHTQIKVHEAFHGLRDDRLVRARQMESSDQSVYRYAGEAIPCVLQNINDAGMRTGG